MRALFLLLPLLLHLHAICTWVSDGLGYLASFAVVWTSKIGIINSPRTQSIDGREVYPRVYYVSTTANVFVVAKIELHM